MIGILLALQVNQWNEEKKDLQIENTALLNLKTEFKKNHKILDIVFSIRLEQEDNIRKYLDYIGNYTISKVKKAEAVPPSANSSVWNPRSIALDGLISTGYIDKIQNDSLKTMLIEWAGDVKMISQFEIAVADIFSENEKFLRKRVYRPIVKAGIHDSKKWPGHYLPKGLQNQTYNEWAEVVLDKEFFNNYSNLLLQLFYLNCNYLNLKNNSETIMKLIDEELRLRSIMD